MDEYADEELQEAYDALSDAEKMRRAGVSEKAIDTRLYYACVHAANAVLYANGFEPRTHQGTIRLFGREVVEPGSAIADDGRFPMICGVIGRRQTTRMTRSMRTSTSCSDGPGRPLAL